MAQNSTNMEEKLFLNTLAFDFPAEPVTFYFAPTDLAETKGLMRLKSPMLYPANIRDIFPDLKNGDAVYTSFDEYHENLIGLPIDFSNSQNTNIIKRYYNHLIFLYFRRNTPLDIVFNDLIRNNQLWVRCKDAEYPDSVKFDRFTIKMGYDYFNNHPQLLLSYDRPTHVSKFSMLQINNRIPQDDPLAVSDVPNIEAMVSKVLYINNGHKIIDHIDYLRKRFPDFDTTRAYPILSHSLRTYLNYPVKDNHHSNPLSRYFQKINDFYHAYMDNEDFRTYVPISKEGFSWANEYQVFTTTYDSKDLLFGHNATNHNPCKGLNNGPFRSVPCSRINLFCIFYEGDKPYARFLMKAIKDGHRAYSNLYAVGAVNPLTGEQEHTDNNDVLKRFTGKDTFFAPAYISFKDERNPYPEVKEQLTQLFEQGKLSRDENYMALYVSPIGKRERDITARHAYYYIKEAMLQEKIEVQVVLQTNIGTLNNDNSILPNYGFEYTLQNMALAICAKMGGMPWKFNVSKKNELVIGIGAFRNTELGATYIGSAFSFDNTGSFNSFEYFLKDEMKELVGSIKDAIIRYSSLNGIPDKLVIHYYKVMSHDREFLPIENMLNTLHLNIPVYVVTVNKTDSEDYVLFDAGNRPDYLPYSGRYVNLGKGMYLLCNNSRYRQCRDRVDSFPFPVKLRIACPTAPNESLDTQLVKDLIEQIFQFSRIYFKSVSQQHLPVSLKYPELVSEILPYFKNETTETLGNQNLWFL